MIHFIHCPTYPLKISPIESYPICLLMSKGDYIYFKKLLFSYVTIASIFQPSFQHSVPLSCLLKTAHRPGWLTEEIALHLTRHRWDVTH